MEWFLIYLVIPVIWMVVAKLKFPKHLTLKEMLIQFGVSTVLCAVFAGITVASQTMSMHDYEILNGQVTNKYSQRVSCTHMEECNCRTERVRNSDGNYTTRRVCDTCPEHPFDVDWIVESTVGSLNISRVNRQGTIEPSRFTEVEIGEPASRRSSYMNYVRGVPESIFNDSEFINEHDYHVPEYPNVYDYYRVDRVINARSSVPSEITDSWNDSLNEALITVGPEHQVNVVVIVTDQDQRYADVMEQEWLRGKKNDMVVVIGTDQGSIDWVKSFGWAESSMVHYNMQSVIEEMSISDDIPGAIIDVIESHYTRQSFSDYAYLLDEVSPPMWVIVMMLILSLALTLGLSVYFIRNDVA